MAKTGRPFLDQMIHACETDLGHELTDEEVLDMLEGLLSSMHETMGDEKWQFFFHRTREQ